MNIATITPNAQIDQTNVFVITIAAAQPVTLVAFLIVLLVIIAAIVKMASMAHADNAKPFKAAVQNLHILHSLYVEASSSDVVYVSVSYTASAANQIEIHHKININTACKTTDNLPNLIKYQGAIVNSKHMHTEMPCTVQNLK